ncbi:MULTISPECIES: hypothetical protein [Marinobacter]|uniref:hypothetical protein n=1 Tax=Marinobacter TaxID=2742 RepID=UPI001D18DD83|nr:MULTISPECIES: hypothetical protein [Marinobacter]MCK2150180.1 hypothetical protein [Marinobacter alexandrii]
MKCSAVRKRLSETERKERPFGKLVNMTQIEWQAPIDSAPDVRDGLTRTERLILYVIHETQRELNGRNVPTAMLYGRVLEYVDMSVAELHVYLDRLGVKGDGYSNPVNPR